MRKFAIIVCLIIVLLSLILSASTPYISDKTAKIIHANTNLYADSSLQSAVLIAIPQNEQIVLLSESFAVGNIIWQKVEYGPHVGYVLYSNLYFVLKNNEYSIKLVKATSKDMGKKINLYISHDLSSQSIQVNDGTKLSQVVSDIDYGDFYKIEYKNDIYFVLKNQVTSGLTFNQKLAIIIASVLGAVIAVIIIVPTIKRKTNK